MMKRDMIIFCLLCSFTGSSAMAASSSNKLADKDKQTASATELTATQIAERNISARGGASAWHRIQSMSMTGMLDAGRERQDGGRIAMMNSPKMHAKMKAELHKAVLENSESVTGKAISLPFQMDLKRPLKSRIEVKFQGDTAVQVYDGSQGWKLRPYLGRHEVEPFTSAEAKIASQQQELDGPLVDYSAKGTKLSLDGAEQINGRKTYKLKLTLKSGEVRHLWVDAKTFLDVKIEGAPRRLDGKLRTVATYFNDYREVAGVKVPYILETNVEGVSGSEKIIIERVAVNPVLDDARFAKPM